MYFRIFSFNNGLSVKYNNFSSMILSAISLRMSIISLNYEKFCSIMAIFAKSLVHYFSPLTFSRSSTIEKSKVS